MKRLMNVACTGVLSTLDEQLQGVRGDEDESANEQQPKVAAKRVLLNMAPNYGCNNAQRGARRISWSKIA
ncbi:hypothetical protein HanPI659440_Chr13g0500241 [Helianthus annuus]|nr:hypothetical protein HanPI659440_Chr13g0500241 [Helianthus annuus]